MMYENPDARETPGLEDYLAALRARWLLVLMITALFTILGYVYVQTRSVTVEARAEVLVNPAPVPRTTENNLPRISLERERGVLSSLRTAELASQKLGIGDPADVQRNVKVEFEPDSDILAVLVKRTDAELARDTANALAESYVELRIADAAASDQALTDSYTALEVELVAQEAALLVQQEDVLDQISRLDESSPSLNQLSTSVNSELSTVKQQLRNVRTDINNAERNQAIRSVAAEVIQFEEIPEFSGIGDRTVYLGTFLLGLILGISTAWVLDRLDRTARETDDVELAVGSKVLGAIPEFGISNRSGAAAVVMLSGGRSNRVQRARESFRRLRSSVQFLAASNEMKSFVVTSARPAEGKSVMITNLAVASAQSGSNVVLVSADMRRPMVEKLLSLPNPENGLSTYLAGSDRSDIALRVDGIANLTVVPAGPLPDNPGELLASQRFGHFIAELTEQFDFVFVDAPPVLSAADSMSAAVHCDGVIVVVDSQNTDTDALLRMSSEIRRAGGQVAGAVMNRDKSDSSGMFSRDRYAYEKVSSQVSS
ncbi:MAG: polysaccharide biosynthesis tyrosine autokinase [Acidimicrobiia bacterium]|nr:polysaccharide biosynthesis tyrosine autokinase [Acidimicrobiia bacterium]